MKLIEEIRQQPLHIRKIFMWTSVVAVFSVVVFFGVNSTKNKFLALLDPQHDAKEAERALAKQESEQEPSPFKALQANISEFFKGKPKAGPQERPTQEPVPPQRLP